jgi:uncharacterized membrane protein YphA (DoxX/SURF4 family)
MLRLISRLIIGLLYLFSGFVKAVDPVGGSIKLTDYFEAFGMDFLIGLSVPLAIVLSTIEFIIGFLLLAGIRVKQASVAAYFMMLFFTVLTLVLALFNPVSDCGCFGDAIKLTNWETFFKNLISLPFTWILYRDRNEFVEKLSRPGINGLTAASVIIAVGISVYSLLYLPVVDFRPFKTGVNIPESMKIPEGAQQAEYKTTFILEKDGKQKEFNEKNYPYDDTTWVFIDSKSVLLKEGYQPPIKDFYVTDNNGNDVSDKLIRSKDPVFLMIAHDLTKVTPKQAVPFVELNKMIRSKKNIKFYCLTSSLYKDLIEFEGSTGAAMNYFFADEVLLQTIIRSNPGLVIINNGTILAKYSYRNVPDITILNDPASYILSENRSGREKTATTIIVLLLIISVLIFYRK